MFLSFCGEEGVGGGGWYCIQARKQLTLGRSRVFHAKRHSSQRPYFLGAAVEQKSASTSNKQLIGALTSEVLVTIVLTRGSGQLRSQIAQTILGVHPYPLVVLSRPPPSSLRQSRASGPIFPQQQFEAGFENNASSTCTLQSPH